MFYYVSLTRAPRCHYQYEWLSVMKAKQSTQLQCRHESHPNHLVIHYSRCNKMFEDITCRSVFRQ
jgi:hypothetical protein